MTEHPKQEFAQYTTASAFIRSRGIYLLPNAFTTAALFAGFYAIIAAVKGQFEWFAVATVIAMFMDSMDGRLARMTGTQTAFGAEYDSLSDMLAFGVAPAVGMYQWCFAYWGKLGWLVTFFYTASTALRLARFNTQLSSTDKQYFQGLPSPAAAGVIVALIWEISVASPHTVQLWRAHVGYQTVCALVVVATSLLMVSRIRYHAFKDIAFKDRVSFTAVLGFVLFFVGIAFHPVRILSVLFVLYALSGVWFTGWSIRMRRQQRKRLGTP